ncbi:MAG: hypothetical protein ACWA5Q_06210 [bacterium]
MSLPDPNEQILQAHASFICQVVEFSHNQDRQQELQQLLNTATENGWASLVEAIRHILAGQRDISVLKSLDHEDQIIAEAILKGMQDPSTLPDPNKKPDPTLAGPGLAHMIHTAGRGNSQALIIISNMAEQMSNAGGDLALIASVIRPLINGERDPEKLCKNLNTNAEKLLLQILEELEKLEAQ